MDAGAGQRNGVYKINYKVSYVGDSGSNADFLTVNTTLMGNLPTKLEIINVD